MLSARWASEQTRTLFFKLSINVVSLPDWIAFDAFAIQSFSCLQPLLCMSRICSGLLLDANGFADIRAALDVSSPTFPSARRHAMINLVNDQLPLIVSCQYENSFSLQSHCTQEKPKYSLLAKSFLGLAVAGLIFAPLPLLAKSMDGFIAFCTSNHDNTGECVNEEDGRKIQCLIVPGQIISCPAQSKSVECIWISGVTANQAQFWCDPGDEAALYEGVLNDSIPDVLHPAPQTIPDSEIDSNPAWDNIFKGSF
jgi:hypothetical protein